MKKQKKNITTIKVKSCTNVKGLASSIIKSFEKGSDEVNVLAIGVGATTQATKARILFRGDAVERGLRIATTEYFVDVNVNDNDNEDDVVITDSDIPTPEKGKTISAINFNFRKIK